MVTRIMNWFDDRLPLTATIERHLTKYPAPINMNIWYLAGVLLVVVLVIQLASGIWLLMNYEATAEGAFASIQYIMRDVEYGYICLLYTSPSPRDAHESRMPSSA